MKIRNTRRRFIKNMFVAGTLSPLAMSVARPILAAGENIPRVIFIYVPDGVYSTLKDSHGAVTQEGTWHPTGDPSNPQLNLMTKAFAPVKEHLVWLQGLNMYGGGGSHQGGARKVLTGNGNDSLDVVLGRQANIGGKTPISNINLGVMANFQAGTTDHVHYLNGVSIKPEDDPVAAFNRVYGITSVGDLGGYDPRRDIVSLTNQELTALMKNDLGMDERLKLETHIDALNQLQKKLDGVSTGGGGDGGLCDITSFNPADFNTESPDGVYPPLIHLEPNFEPIAKLQVDLITRLLACDMTRVAGLQFSHTTSNFRSHHSISHNFSQAWVDSLNFFYGFIVQLIQSLKAVPDGTGTLLDNTLIYMYSCLGDGKLHDHDDMPFMLAGGGAKGIRGNRQLHFNGADHTKLLVTIAGVMGYEIDSFGTNGVSGGLSGIV